MHAAGVAIIAHCNFSQVSHASAEHARQSLHAVNSDAVCDSGGIMAASLLVPVQTSVPLGRLAIAYDYYWPLRSTRLVFGEHLDSRAAQ